MAHEEEVLTANRAFYAAFAADDAEAMDALWARQVPVACIHPGWDPLRGRKEVMASWRAIFERGSPPIAYGDATVYVAGDVALVVCYELLPGARLAATNVFVNEQGKWRIAHHHAAAVAMESEEADGSTEGWSPGEGKPN